MIIRYNTNPKTEESDYSGVILCKNREDIEFEVPLWDVRDGSVVRNKAETMLKLSNGEKGSKYIPKGNKFI